MVYRRFTTESEGISANIPVCVHMRSKAMYTTGEMQNPDHPDEAGSHYSWCNLTQHVLGPDRCDVDRCQCVPGRRCYQAVYEV